MFPAPFLSSNKTVLILTLPFAKECKMDPLVYLSLRFVHLWFFFTVHEMKMSDAYRMKKWQKGNVHRKLHMDVHLKKSLIFVFYTSTKFTNFVPKQSVLNLQVQYSWHCLLPCINSSHNLKGIFCESGVSQCYQAYSM